MFFRKQWTFRWTISQPRSIGKDEKIYQATFQLWSKIWKISIEDKKKIKLKRRPKSQKLNEKAEIIKKISKWTAMHLHTTHQNQYRKNEGKWPFGTSGISNKKIKKFSRTALAFYFSFYRFSSSKQDVLLYIVYISMQLIYTHQPVVNVLWIIC